MKKLFFLAGLPRTGSTLLTSILYQNPLIHTEGSSALCETMWVTKNSLEKDNDIYANKREATIKDVVSGIPKLFYKNVKREVVIDKCFLWILDGNIEMLKKYVTPKPKFIVMERPTDEVVASFVRLMEKNNSNGVYDGYIQASTGSLKERREKAILSENGSFARQLLALQQVKRLEDQSLFHYVTYKDLVSNTKETIDGIYDFLGLPRFEHDFTNVVNHFPQNDKVWGLSGMHAIRPLVKQL